MCAVLCDSDTSNDNNALHIHSYSVMHTLFYQIELWNFSKFRLKTFSIYFCSSHTRLYVQCSVLHKTKGKCWPFILRNDNVTDYFIKCEFWTTSCITMHRQRGIAKETKSDKKMERVGHICNFNQIIPENSPCSLINTHTHTQ